MEEFRSITVFDFILPQRLFDVIHNLTCIRVSSFRLQPMLLSLTVKRGLLELAHVIEEGDTVLEGRLAPLVLW